MSVKNTIRRLLYGNTEGDKLDDTPIELPAGHHRLKSAAQEIQEQIAIQIALKQAQNGEKLQTIGEIEAELEELENDSVVTDFPEYDYIELGDHYEADAELPAATERTPAGPPLEEGESKKDSGGEE